MNLNPPISCIFIFGKNKKSEVDMAECIRPPKMCFQIRTAEGNKPFLLLPCDAEDSPDCAIFVGGAFPLSFSNKCVRASFIVRSLSRGLLDTHSLHFRQADLTTGGLKFSNPQRVVRLLSEV